MTAAEPVTMLDHALAYQRIGWHIFPLHSPVGPGKCDCNLRTCTHIGKHPRTAHGLNDASNDEEQIRKWWTMWPNANIGVSCGPSKIVAIDVDPRHGGDEDWTDLVEKHGRTITDTITAVTGGGGAHYIYQQPAEMRIPNVSNSEKYTGPLGGGVDVRAQGGYIVVAPSRHETGNYYEWDADNSPFERLPQRLPLSFAEILSEPARQNEDREPISVSTILEGVPEGGRDWTLFQMASKLRYADVPIDWAYKLVEAAGDACTPPFGRTNSRKKVDSAYRRYDPGGGAFVDPDEAAQAEREDAPAAWVDWSTFWNLDPRVEDWLIEPVLPRGRSIALYSPAKQGKSLFALDLVARAATGQRVLDRPACEPLNVVYLDLEMTEDDLYERLEDMGYGPATDFSHLFYYLLPSLPPLDTRAGGAKLLEICQLHDADLVVIDTTSRVLKGPENDADTLRAMYMCTGLPLKADNRTVLRLDHAGKNLESGQRGTSAKNDDVDLVWELTAEGGGVVLRATHRRQSWVPERLTMVRLEDPLRHERGVHTWQPGTQWVAGEMNRLDIPLDFGARKVRDLLRSDGVKARNAVIADAIRYRREAAQDLTPKAKNTPPNVSPEGSGHTGTHEIVSSSWNP